MSREQGVLLTIFSASSFGFIPLFTKIAYANGFNPYTFCFFRSLFATIELFILLKIRKINYTFDKEQYISLFNSFILFAISIFMGKLETNFTFKGIVSTVLVALVANLMGMVSFKVGLKAISATTAAILSIFEPLTSLILGMLILRKFYPGIILPATC